MIKIWNTLKGSEFKEAVQLLAAIIAITIKIVKQIANHYETRSNDSYIHAGSFAMVINKL